MAQLEAYRQFKSVWGSMYVRPSQIAAIGHMREVKLRAFSDQSERIVKVRTLHLSGGGTLVMLDSPENMSAAGMG